MRLIVGAAQSNGNDIENADGQRPRNEWQNNEITGNNNNARNKNNNDDNNGAEPSWSSWIGFPKSRAHFPAKKLKNVAPKGGERANERMTGQAEAIVELSIELLFGIFVFVWWHIARHSV